MRVSAAGGVATPLRALDPRRSEMLHYSARFLPDGRHFLYVRSSRAEGSSGVFVGSIDAKPEQQDPRRLVATRGRVDYAPSVDDSGVGHLLFNREGMLFAQSFDGPDGRFITIKDAAMRTSAPPMSVILNWPAGLMK